MNRPCPKSGIKIHDTTGGGVNRNPIHISHLDMNIDNYSYEDILKLFNIHTTCLTDNIMKDAKNIALKMHPDKSGLDAKCFIFFSEAYKRLQFIYEFQNKSTNKKLNREEYELSDDNKYILDKLTKDPKSFNQYFNKAFEKHNKKSNDGYGEWLKSNEGFLNINQNVTLQNMNQVFETSKKQIQAIIPYDGIVNELVSPSFGASSLSGDDNHSSSYYTDLKQAYTQTLIPVSQEDYNSIKKYENVNAYKKHRDQTDITPINKLEAEQILYKKHRKDEVESMALAHKYAMEAQKVQNQQKSFWAELKQLAYS